MIGFMERDVYRVGAYCNVANAQLCKGETIVPRIGSLGARTIANAAKEVFSIPDIKRDPVSFDHPFRTQLGFNSYHGVKSGLKGYSACTNLAYTKVSSYG